MWFLHKRRKKQVNCLEYCKHLESKGVQPEQIEQTSMNLSLAFIAGIKDYFSSTWTAFDYFHVVTLLNEAIDAMRYLEINPNATGHIYRQSR